MASSKTKIFIIFILYFSCISLVSISGIRVNPSCTGSKECELQCSNENAQCLAGMCHCSSLKAEMELTNTITYCDTDKDCPDPRECPKNFYSACLHGECMCTPV
ncbi:Defensin-like protein [Cardamine amara subsp. amara]|uniref:Defensin-like protein n=1 Tax=Cardamine amara subsp. amara TaxID=228776 RepID=A0ABD1AN45_CARAN